MKKRDVFCAQNQSAFQVEDDKASSLSVFDLQAQLLMHQARQIPILIDRDLCMLRGTGRQTMPELQHRADSLTQRDAIRSFSEIKCHTGHLTEGMAETPVARQQSGEKQTLRKPAESEQLPFSESVDQTCEDCGGTGHDAGAWPATSNHVRPARFWERDCTSQRTASQTSARPICRRCGQCVCAIATSLSASTLEPSS